MSAWRLLSHEEAAAMERELARELPRGHLLEGRAVRATARRDDCDDVAFLVDDRLCVVHLTWSVESDPRWPACRFVVALPEKDE
jgi:hypothetical protein